MDLFKECLPSLLEGKKYIMEDPSEESSYNPYIINRALSSHIDCILHVSEMNKYPNLDKKMQYDYLYHSIRKYKRKFQPWLKGVDKENIDLVKRCYYCNDNVAKQYLDILSEDQLILLSKFLDKGGKE